VSALPEQGPFFASLQMRGRTVIVPLRGKATDEKTPEEKYWNS